MHADSKGLVAGMSVAELKARIEREPYAKLWERLERRTREVMALVREGDFTTTTYGALGWHSITPMSREAALIYHLTGDEDALRYVEQCIAAVDGVWRDKKRLKRAPAGNYPANSHGEIALAADLCRDGLSNQTLEILLPLMRDSLIDFHRGEDAYVGYGGGGNISYCQMINAAWCALAWGEDCGHPAWQEVIRHAVNYTRCYLRRGCDSQGFGYEGTTYSGGVFHYIYLFAQTLFQNGGENLFETEPVMRAIPDAMCLLVFPDGSALMNINDHGLLPPQSLSWLHLTAKHYDNPMHLGLWRAFEGPGDPRRPYGDVMPWFRNTYMPGVAAVDEQAGMLQSVLHWDADATFTPLDKCPLPTSMYSQGTETSNFRTSWGPDAVYVNFLGAGRSHASQTHRHADCGHFSIVAHGEYLAIDTGRYNCDEDQHSVVLVDGKCHMPNEGWGMSKRPGRLDGFQRHEMLSYVRADMAFMKDCEWADRHLLFVPIGGDDCYVVTIDNFNKDSSRHFYQWQLQTNPECALQIDGKDTARLVGGKARLDLSFLIPGPEDFPQEPHSLELQTDTAQWSRPYGKEVEETQEKTALMITSVRRPRLNATVTGLNGQIMAVMVPRKPDQPSLAVRQVPERRVMRAEIDCGPFTDTVVAALDHGCLQLADIEGFAEIALIRRDKNGKLIGSWTSSGEELNVL